MSGEVLLLGGGALIAFGA
jgi:palmitoyltransferase ZDHHC4